jgi:hypothetical protein
MYYTTFTIKLEPSFINEKSALIGGLWGVIRKYSP